MLGRQGLLGILDLAAQLLLSTLVLGGVLLVLLLELFMR
jgi:hypothetical protein